MRPPGAAVVSNTRDPDAIPAELTVDAINREYKRLLDEQLIRVTYRISHDARPPIISTTSTETNFDLWLNVYGEFPALAYVERKNKPGVWLTRYLDLPGRPPD